MPGIWYELEHIFDVDGVQIGMPYLPHSLTLSVILMGLC